MDIKNILNSELPDRTTHCFISYAVALTSKFFCVLFESALSVDSIGHMKFSDYTILHVIMTWLTSTN